MEDLNKQINDFTIHEKIDGLDSIMDTMDNLDLNDPDEYELLEEAYDRNFSKLSIEEQNDVIMSYETRYRRYLQHINDWNGYGYIQDDMLDFLNTHCMVRKKMLSKRIDKDLYTTINSYRLKNDY